MGGEKTRTQTLSTGFEGEKIGSQGVMGKSKNSSKSLGREVTVFQITTSVLSYFRNTDFSRQRKMRFSVMIYCIFIFHHWISTEPVRLGSLCQPHI